MFLCLNSRLLIAQLITPLLVAKEEAEMELLSTSEKKGCQLLLNIPTKELRGIAKNQVEITNLHTPMLSSMDVMKC